MAGRSLFTPAKESTMRLASNKTAYEDRSIVEHYIQQNELQKPERTILNLLSDQLPAMRMLDIGVGAGRTTQHFSSLVAEYVAVDYAENMIKACEQRFVQAKPHVSFRVCDVRSMAHFPDSHFDFVLFSYNGIDSISHEDRLLAFKEIRRVCKTGGLFGFSSHNLQSIDQLLAVQPGDLLRTVYRRWIRNPLLILLNDKFRHLKQRPFAVLKDGTHRFKLNIYYVKPSEQLNQIASSGFKNPRIFQLNGEEIQNSAALLGSVTDHWLYYLCVAS